MQQIKLTRGLDVKMDGKAALADGSVMKPSVYHIVPDHFAGIKPRLLLHEGDKVKAGSRAAWKDCTLYSVEGPHPANKQEMKIRYSFAPQQAMCSLSTSYVVVLLKIRNQLSAIKLF